MRYLDSSQFEMSDPSSYGMILREVKSNALFSSQNRYRTVLWQSRDRSYTVLCRVSYAYCLFYLPSVEVQGRQVTWNMVSWEYNAFWSGLSLSYLFGPRQLSWKLIIHLQILGFNIYSVTLQPQGIWEVTGGSNTELPKIGHPAYRANRGCSQ